MRLPHSAARTYHQKENKMPFLLPPKSPLASKHESGRASCSMLGGALRSLDDNERTEHLVSHARTCDDAPGKMFAACPICRPLRLQYIDHRIEEGSVRWFYSNEGTHEFGTTGESPEDVRQRLLAATGSESTEVEIVFLEVSDDQSWAQIRSGAEVPSAPTAADALERETVSGDLRWIATPESAWLLQRYSS